MRRQTPGSKKPLNSGRADYYGMLANVAARVMGLANPGQVRPSLSFFSLL
jgi:hypothetical protein